MDEKSKRKKEMQLIYFKAKTGFHIFISILTVLILDILNFELAYKI